MILAIDIGNTNIVLGCIRDGKQLFSARIASDRNKTADPYALDIRGIFELQKAIESYLVSTLLGTSGITEIPARPLITEITAIAADTSELTGKCGENAVYTLDKDGTLTISGTGDMAAYPTWDSSKESIGNRTIKKIVVRITDGVDATHFIVEHAAQFFDVATLCGRDKD